VGEIAFQDTQGRRRRGTLRLEVTSAGTLGLVGFSGSCRPTLGALFARGSCSGPCRTSGFGCSCSGSGACIEQLVVGCVGSCPDPTDRCLLRGGLQCGCGAGIGPILD
jgi:hypothetical protein